MIHYKIGDATKPEGSGLKIIAHVCNDVGAWGAGFTKALDKISDRPRLAYRRMPKIMGELSFAVVSLGGLMVVNMIAQQGLRSRNNPVPLCYMTLSDCLKDLRAVAMGNNATVHMPQIGSGLAGDDWEKIEGIIEEELRDVDVTIYEEK